MNSKYNYNDAQVPEPKYDTDTANKYYVDKVAKRLSGDIEGDISGIATDIATKSKNYTSAPNPPYNVGDTYMNGDDIYICITSREYGSFTQADWKLASKYDNTQDIIDGGITTTQGTFIVTDSAGTTAAGLTAYGTGNNNVRIWAGSSIGNRNSAPFRVTQGGYLYASNANISGTITATSGVFDNVTINGTCTINGGAIKTGTIAAARLDSSVITTTNFNAQNINASKITSGTLSTDRLESKVITTDNFSAQNINADKITAGTLSAANISLKNVSLTPTISSLAGWIVDANRLSTGNNGIYANGELYMYPPGGGILALNDGLKLKAPSGIAIYNDTATYGNNTLQKGITLLADSGNLVLGMKSSAYSVNIRSYCSPSIRANAGSTCMLLASASDLFFYSNSGTIWAEGNSLSNSRVLTNAGASSSKNVKTNIKKFERTKYDEALSLLKKMDLYEYDYKYNIYKNPHKYGFIIDELEQLEETKDFFEFEEYNATIKDNKIDFSGAMEGEKLKTKNYDSDVLDKYLLTCIKALQNKIEVLENKIKEMEGNK